MLCGQQKAISRQTENIVERLLHFFYSVLGGALYLLVSLFLPLTRIIPLFNGKYSYGLSERLGYYPTKGQTTKNLPCLWIHAASVGEVQAALQLIDALEERAYIVLSSNTEQGHRLACSRLHGRALCLMAPLDVPQAVSRALAYIQPDVYVCLETELWPVLLAKISRAGITMFLLNGRISERSFGRYYRIRFFMRPLLRRFHAVAAISAEDGDRFLALGLPEERLRVCGNMKYDLYVPTSAEARQARDMLRQRLDLADKVVFICGSTHSDEERQLLDVYNKLRLNLPLVWILAPRHLERIAEVKELLQTSGYDQYSLLKKEEKKRSQSVIVVDTMGDLADLYACGDYLFCGGSLVNKGGHNLMEAARWGRPVYFGPYTKDFNDAARTLQQTGAGFQVENAEALSELILNHHAHAAVYHKACAAALELAAKQQGSVKRQVDLIHPALNARVLNP